MCISYSDTHSNVWYGKKPNSLYDRILRKLEAMEYEGFVKRDIAALENRMKYYYDSRKLTEDEYLKLLSIIQPFAAEEQIYECNNNKDYEVHYRDSFAMGL